MTPREGRDPSDEELVDSYRRNRDATALDVLVGRYVECTRRLIYGIVLRDADADDLTQETFLHAARGLAGFDTRAKFSTWLYRIALNTTRRFLKRRTSSAAGSDRIAADQKAPPGEEPDTKTLYGELHGEIVKALESLSPPLRAAMVLRAIEGLPTEEAAQIEGCTPETMRWRVHEARKILKKRLADYLKP